MVGAFAAPAALARLLKLGFLRGFAKLRPMITSCHFLGWLNLAGLVVMVSVLGMMSEEQHVSSPGALGLLPAQRRVELTENQRERLRQVLAPLHAQYDPLERMLRQPLRSPGYHTTLKGGFVHPTRSALHYAVALLDTGDSELQKRAQDVLRPVIALQDQNPQSKTYGIWSWFLEEPLDRCAGGIGPAAIARAGC
jgi:hypothetical protein